MSGPQAPAPPSAADPQPHGEPGFGARFVGRVVVLWLGGTTFLGSALSVVLFGAWSALHAASPELRNAGLHRKDEIIVAVGLAGVIASGVLLLEATIRLLVAASATPARGVFKAGVRAVLISPWMWLGAFLFLAGPLLEADLWPGWFRGTAAVLRGAWGVGLVCVVIGVAGAAMARTAWTEAVASSASLRLVLVAGVAMPIAFVGYGLLGYGTGRVAAALPDRPNQPDVLPAAPRPLALAPRSTFEDEDEDEDDESLDDGPSDGGDEPATLGAFGLPRAPRTSDLAGAANDDCFQQFAPDGAARRAVEAAAVRACPPDVAASDVVHVMALAICAAEKERPDDLPSYASSSATHHCLDQRRRQARWASCPLEDVPLPSCRRSPEEQYLSAEEAEMVRSVLCRLSEEDQRIIRMRYFEELDGAELAKKLGVAPAAARKRLERAMTRLRKEFTSHCGGF